MATINRYYGLRIGMCSFALALMCGCASQTKIEKTNALAVKSVGSNIGMVRNESCTELSCVEKNSDVVVEIDPNPGSGLVMQFSEPKSVTNGTVETIVAKKTITVSGQMVDHTFFALSGPIIPFSKDQTDVIAIVAAAFSGARPQKTQIFAKTTLNQEGEFALPFAVGSDYTVIVNSNGANKLPPSFFEFRAETDLAKEFGDRDPHSITGTVELSGAAAAGERYELRVLQDGVQISSTHELETGEYFRAYLASPRISNSKLVTLEISPVKKNSPGPHFSKEIILKPDQDTDLGVVRLRVLEPVSRKLTILSQSGDPVEGAHLYLRSSDAQSAGGVSVFDAFTDKNGVVALSLPGGNYQIAVVPPSHQPHAVFFEDALLTNDRIITLEARSSLSGKVESWTAEPVAGAQLDLSCTYEDPRMSSVLSDPSMHIQAMSDKNGNWCANKRGNVDDSCQRLWLDKVRCTGTIVPPAGSVLPLYNLGLTFPNQAVLNVTLEKPQLLQGLITLPNNGGPLVKAFVRIFVQDSDGKQQVLGQTISDENGRYTAYVRPGF